MNHNEVRMQLSMRIRHENFFFGGRMSNEHALAWKAYLTGIHEWRVITAADLWYLRGLLPEVQSEAVEEICSGRTIEMPDLDRIKELEPKVIPQAPPPTIEIIDDVKFWASGDSWQISKPKYISGRIEEVE